ncbi:MAG: hypothetical protein QW587_06775 [Candidatus Bathyarchaeia archaeon]
MNKYSSIFILIGFGMLIFSRGDLVLTQSGLILTLAAYIYPLVTALTAKVWPEVQSTGSSTEKKEPPRPHSLAKRRPINP